MSCLADWRDEHAVDAEAGGAVEPGEGGVESIFIERNRSLKYKQVFESKVLSNLMNHHPPSIIK